MSRIPFPTPDTMSPEQRAVYDKVVSGPRGKVEGPLRAALYNAELADKWQALGALLRYGTGLSPRLSETAILATGLVGRSPFEWYAHRRESEKIGIETDVLDAMLAGTEPPFRSNEEAVVYKYATELATHRSVSDATYAKALELFGARTVVELTALVGYYTMVAMTLNAHEIPFPEGVTPAFPLPQHDGLV
ncbi:MAG: carboxymuconolactone decarboxylase family protein [Pseudomonadota bacterium]